MISDISTRLPTNRRTTMPTFADVKAILDQAIADWTNANAGAPDLTVHNTDGNAPFGWGSNDILQKATAKGFRLIDPAVVHKNPPRGAQALLVRILSGKVTLTPPAAQGGGPKTYPQMPDGGPYLTDTDAGKAKIKTIADWIDAGCPD